MAYIVSSGSLYLGKDKTKKTIVTENIKLARKYQNINQAQHCIKNEIPAPVRSLKWIATELQQDNISADDQGEGLDDKIKVILTKDEEVELINNCQKEIDTFVKQLNKIIEQGSELTKVQAKLDQSISDIMHYVELNAFDACTGYKMAKRLRDITQQRRVVKNQLYLIGILKQHCESLLTGKTSKAIVNLQNQKYQPRVLDELFTSNDKKKEV